MQMPGRADVGGVRGWRAGAEGEVLLHLRGAIASIAVARDGTVRLRAARGSKLPGDPGPAIGRHDWRPAPAEPYRRDGGGVVLRFEGVEGAVDVQVDPEPFAARVFDRTGRLLAELSGLELGDDDAAAIHLAAPPGAHYFGFGEKWGSLDKRGQRLVMRNRDAHLRPRVDPLYLSIPFFLELRPAEGSQPSLATGVLLDSYAPSQLDVAASHPGRIRLETLAGGLDVCVFPGPTPAEVLARYTARVGRAPLPPLWALGHHQSRWSYRSARQLRRVARGLRRRRIPTDALHLDVGHMRGYRSFSWHPRRFRDPAALLRELARDGFHVVTIVDPGVKVDPEDAVYRDGLERDVFCRREDGSPFSLRVWPGDAALPDFNREEVRAWWGEQHRPLLEAGVAGIWNDMNEPAGWRRDVRVRGAILPLRGQDLSDVVQADPVRPKERVPHEHVRNLYGHQQCRATRAFLEGADRRRPFVLTRSGFAGIGQHAAVWTGDNASRWEQLRQSLPMLLNLSLSGVPFCGADIGGFAGRPGRELFARWMQIGALYPFARTHTWWLHPRQEPWRFGRRVERIARSALELRMRLLPYLYGLFRAAQESGAPVWRPLFYEFPDDADSAGVEDQVMIGPWLLAAPVVRRGQRQRSVYLPPGVWYAYHDDARYVGPRTVLAAAPLEQLPLFVRGGAVLPTQSAVQHVAEPPEEPRVLEVFPGEDTTTDLVEDDGVTRDHQDGVVARTRVVLRNRAANRLRLEIRAREGPYPVAERTLCVVVHGCPSPHSVRLDALPLEMRAALPGYGAQDGRVHVRLLDNGDPHAIEIEPSP